MFMVADPFPVTRGANLRTVLPNVSLWEILIVLLVVLLIFGPKRLPEMGRSLGKGMREFKDSVSGKDDDERPQLEPPIAAPDTTTSVAPREHDTV